MTYYEVDITLAANRIYGYIFKWVKIFPKKNTFDQNVTEFVTSTCYTHAINRNLPIANLPKGRGAKLRGLKFFKP